MEDNTAVESTILKHYGVKGMRWGVRKKRGKPTDALSNEELKKRITRLELENKFNKLSTPPTSASKKFMETMMNSIGQQTVRTITAMTTKTIVDKYNAAKAAGETVVPKKTKKSKQKIGF